MTIKAMKDTMRFLYENDKESYDEFWSAMQTLSNLGLMEKKFTDAMGTEDHKLFDEENK